MTRPPKRRDTLARLERAAMRWWRVRHKQPLDNLPWETLKSLVAAIAAHAAAKGKRGKK